MARRQFKPIPPLEQKYIDRFWDKVDIRGPEECWPWKASLQGVGYGQFNIPPEILSSNVILAFIKTGEDPKENRCRLTCGNNSCCNPGHLSIEPPRTIRDRIMDLVTIEPNGCWQFNGVLNGHGYGMMETNHYNEMAHRASYKAFIGPIPKGMIVDHTCHDPALCHLGLQCPHRRCLNPNHLTVTTRKHNSSRSRRYFPPMEVIMAVKGPRTQERRDNKTVCFNGHDLTGRNRSIAKNGIVVCRECRKLATERYRSKITSEKSPT